ncbi:MAG: phosphatase PAP2 family protein [Crocinitomicaceae bacterium]
MKSIFLLVLLISNFAFCQPKSKLPRLEKINWNGEKLDLKTNSLIQKSVVPLSFCAAGLLLNQTEIKTNLQASFLNPFNGYKTTLDDYIQYAPIVQMYGFDFLRLPARNSIWNQSKYLVVSELVTAGIVHLLKNTLKVLRPDGSARTSFPSGHTGQAFVASQVLFNEYYRTRPALALSGYLFSASTGALRIINNRHWVPDVFMGAGIAILVTNVVYYFEPLKNWDPFKKANSDTSILVVPEFRNETYGMNLKIRF